MSTTPQPASTFDRRDAALLKQLGLKSDNVELWEEAFLGHTTLDNGVQVSVWVTSTPSLFFRFEFTFQRAGTKYGAQTGSGAFTDFWNIAFAFANGSIKEGSAVFELKEIAEGEDANSTRGQSTQLLQDCSSCGTVYQFNVTKEQALRYEASPRLELIQDIFPEIPIPARAVLTQGNICGLCLPQLNEGVKDLIRSFVLTPGTTFEQ